MEIELIKFYGRQILGTGTLVNICDGGEGNRGYIHTEEWKTQQSLKRKGKKLGPLSNEAKKKLSDKLKNKKQYHINQMKPVLQYDLEGNFIKEYESAIEAKRITKISGISDNASSYKNGKNKTAGGYLWFYKNSFNEQILKEKIENAKIKKPSPSGASKKISLKLMKPVLQYDLEGNFIKEWSSLKEASYHCNIHQSNISNCCRGTQRTCKNYIWKFKNN